MKLACWYYTLGEFLCFLHLSRCLLTHRDAFFIIVSFSELLQALKDL